MKKAMILLLLLCGMVIFIPTFFSTSFGKNWLVGIIEKKTKMQVQIETVHLSWLGPQKFQNISFSNRDVEGKMEFFQSPLYFWKILSMERSFYVKKGELLFYKEPDAKLENIELTLDQQDVRGSATTAQGGGISLQGKVFAKDHFDLALSFSKIPSLLIDLIFETKGLFAKAAGPFFDLESKWFLKKENGTLKVDFSSEEMQTAFEGVLSPNVLTLETPLIGTLSISPAFSGEFLDLPLRSTAPTILRIFPEGFKTPYRSFSLQDLSIGRARLDLNKMELLRPAPFQALFNLFQHRLPSTLPIWWAPCQFQLKNGTLTLGRLDFLLDHTLHLCIFGKVDFIKNKLHLYLGIPKETLARILNVQGVSDDFVLKLPIKGTLQNPKVETEALTAQIAAEVAKQALQKQSGLLKGVFNLFSTLKEDGDVPPAQRPFPWEK